MNADDLKTAWRDTGSSLDRNEVAKIVAEQVAGEMRKNSNRTSLDNMRNAYRRFAIFAAVMCPVSLIIFNSSIFPDLQMAFMSIAFAVFFAVTAAIDFSFYRGLGRIDCNTMTVREVAERARHFRKRHLQVELLLIPFALAIVGWLAYLERDDQYMIAGIVTGGIVGGIFGVRFFLKFMKEYKELSREDD